MVILSIVAPSNEHTVYFDSPIEKPRFINLKTCSLYNTWFNLKTIGYLTYKSGGRNVFSKMKYIYPGHYTVDSLTDALSKAFAPKKPLIITKNTLTHELTIEKTSEIDGFTFDKNLGELFVYIRDDYGKNLHHTAEITKILFHSLRLGGQRKYSE